MRFSTSALVVVLLQNSSYLSPNDAFSPPLVVKKSSSSSSVQEKKHDALYARHDDEDGQGNALNDNDVVKSRIASSMLLGGAAFQLSTSKVSACCNIKQFQIKKSFPLSQLFSFNSIMHTHSPH